MVSSTEQRKEEFTSSTRIAAGVILGLSCLAAVLTGGVFVAQTIDEQLAYLNSTNVWLEAEAEEKEVLVPDPDD